MGKREEVRERPILFSAAMVRAILDGSKTQTRRVAKVFNDLPNMDGILARYPEQHGCPHGEVGGKLWVRETWADVHPCCIQQGRYSQPGQAGIPGPPGVPYRTVYRADGEVLPYWRMTGFPYRTTDRAASIFPDSEFDPNGCETGWNPSIHMPRKLSRITLEITGVRVERLQSITSQDCWAEGIPHSPDVDPRHEFIELWQSINGAESWDANPWVWVIEFKRVKP